MILPIVTVASMLLAAIMSVIAWRIAGDERRRSEARVAALAAEIRADDEDVLLPPPIDHVGRVLWDPPIDLSDPAIDRAHVGRVLSEPPIFSARQPPSGARPFAIVGGGALVFGAALAIAIVSSGRFSGMARATQGATPAAIPVSAAAEPLELVALGHERVGDQLTVRGVVRNPAAGAGIDRVTAVVLLFNLDGGFLTSGRAEVDAASLRPGAESTFAITVPRAADVARYRVSFRTDDHVVPHLDRRHES